MSKHRSDYPEALAYVPSGISTVNMFNRIELCKSGQLADSQWCSLSRPVLRFPRSRPHR
jgi:hypothetical protein